MNAGKRREPSKSWQAVGIREAEHRATSEQIYRMSWGRQVAARPEAGWLLATGYSCRSQAKIMDGTRLPHPAEALLACLRDG